MTKRSDREQWLKIRPILETAQGLDSAERADFLARTCKGDRALRRAVETYLGATEEVSGFLDPAGELSGPAARREVANRRGSRILQRLFDSSKWSDYLLCGAYAACPAVAAMVIGAHRTMAVQGLEVAGYWSRLNWLSMILVLPLSLLSLRWAMGKIAPVHAPRSADCCPPIVNLIETEDGRRQAYEALRGLLLSPWTFAAAFLITTVILVLDTWDVLSVYLAEAPELAEIRERDWSVAFVGSAVPRWQNLALVVLAYSVQFLAFLNVAVLIIAVLLHNLFFLGRVYQARRDSAKQTASFIIVDLDDVNRCFGFRRADEAFNTQVLFLTLLGSGMLVSRYANVLGSPERMARQLDLDVLFPDIGQVLIGFIWLLVFAIVSLPAAVKLLPRVPFFGSRRASRSITTYLREYLPDSKWPYGDDPTSAEVDQVAARFAANAFWPTGNNRAATLFFFSFWVFLVILLPLVPQPGRIPIVLSIYVGMILVALVATISIFNLLKWSLAYIDVRLVRAPKTTVVVADSATRPRAQAPQRVRRGSRLGIYEIEESLGEGGMGEVFKARDTRLGREVAIKVLRPGLSEERQRRRFEREARILASLNHPFIATLFHFDQAMGMPYLVLELVQGETLANRLVHGSLPAGQAIGIGLEIAQAMDFAHRQGVIHRDLKPANIMVTATGTKLLDFGIAKIFEPDPVVEARRPDPVSALTLAGEHPGTPLYMSPEQISGERLDPRTDLFSFGSVLYEMLTGVPAFNGDTHFTVINAILRETPRPMRDLRSGLPSSLQGLVESCLEKARERRLQSSAELVAELQRIRAVTSVEPPPAARD